MGILSEKTILGWRKDNSWVIRGIIPAILNYPLVSLVAISSGLGYAASRGDLYFYHLVLVAGFVLSFASGIKIKKKTWYTWVAIWLGLLAWGILWPSFWNNPSQALVYLAVILIGLGGTFLLTIKIKTTGALIAAIGGLLVAETANMFFGYLEIFDIFHLPTKTGWLVAAGLDPKSLEVLQRMPSAFDVNPNNFAVAMLIPLSLATTWLLTKRSTKRIFAWIILLAVLFITIFTRSRGIALGVTAVLFVALIWWQRKHRVLILSSIAVSIILLVFLYPYLLQTIPELGDMFSIFDRGTLDQLFYYIRYALVDPQEAAQFTYEEYGSFGARAGYMAQAIYALQKTHGLGLGPGGLISLHNLYFEILANAGVIGFLFLLVLGFQLFRKSILLSKSSNPMFREVGLFSLLFWTGFAVSAITISTVFYFLPMYTMLGISFSAFNLYRTKRLETFEPQKDPTASQNLVS